MSTTEISTENCGILKEVKKYRNVFITTNNGQIPTSLLEAKRYALMN